MSDFTTDWLSLREPFDAAARSGPLAARFAALLPPRPRLLDLGGGTGANARYLAALIDRPHRWTVVDADGELLARARAPRDDVELRRVRRDLVDDLGDLLDGADAVTASALMDLVSAAWADRLAADLAARRLPALFALSYDGRQRFDPPAEHDPLVIAAFNRHQRGDKGFGPALGPAAPAHLQAALAARGYRVFAATADWTISPSASSMLENLVDGTAQAAAAIAPGDAEAIGAWRRGRRRDITARRLSLRVGHVDLLAEPPATR